MCCDGAGGGYDWKDRDPIEGWKMAPRHECWFCNGRGFITHDDIRFSAVVQYYNELEAAELRKKTTEEQREARRVRVRKEAIEKLTKEERDALGVYDDE
jgi:hypothetical protein